MRDTVVYILGMLLLLAVIGCITYDFYRAASGQETFSVHVREFVARTNAPHIYVGIGLIVGFALGVIVGFIMGHLFWC